MKQINKNVEEYYDETFKKFGTSSAEAVGWKNKDAQTVRFDQLLKVINEKSNFSINDLGCGVGALLPYLHEQGYHDFNYAGYDMLEPMIAQAKDLQSAFKNGKFVKINSSNELLPADYSVASGIFSLKYDLPEYEFLNTILENIHNMDKFSAKGFAFNALTKYSDQEYKQDYLYYADPLFLFDYCKRNFSKNVALLHDYTEYDFTILVRK